ncbi:MAG: hypothetical protein WA364_28750, partial [Candidatus Nitrosopolaris sp.]
FTIVPEGNTSYGNTSYAYPPPTIAYSWEPGNNPDCSNCYFQMFTIHLFLIYRFLVHCTLLSSPLHST